MSNDDESHNSHGEPGISKDAGLTVYLMEELTDARMRCDQLKRYVAQAVKLINDSEKKDHFFEVAGNLLYGIPETLFKLDKALDATALAATRLDYEELKQQLKPEKAEQLEQVLNDVRIRHIERRSEPSLQGKTAMRTFKAAAKGRISSALRRIADEVDAARIAPEEASLRIQRVLMALSQTAEQAVQAVGPLQAGSREEVMKGFKSANPDLSDEELNEIADQWEKNKDVVKDKAAADAKQSEEDKKSKFEEGKPADPTENMSPEDAKTWKEEHDKNKDQFKAASAGDDFSWKS